MQDLLLIHFILCFYVTTSFTWCILMKKNIIPLLYLAFLVSMTSSQAMNFGNPTANEQAHLEAINRARMNPLAEAARLGIDLFEGTKAGAISSQPVQPLSSNAQLIQSARGHSQDMLDRNFFEHDNPNGETPFDRISSAGYSFQAAEENIAFGGSTGAIDETFVSLFLHDSLFIDADFLDRGHRVSILDSGFREVGVGLAFGQFFSEGVNLNAGMLTTDFARKPGSLPILLGVVYQDLDGNQIYDAGEGVDAVDIRITGSGNLQTTTASAGGYGVEVTANKDYSLTFTHPDLGTLTRNVRVGNLNVKLDVLVDEFFGTSEVSAQCSTFSNNKLSVPCVTVGNQVFTAQLSLINDNPIQLILDSAQQINQANLNQCANFNQQTLQVQFPCIVVGSNNFQVNIKLIDNVSFKFELVNFSQN